MHETAPSVFLIARPSLELEGMRGYLRDVGGEPWLERRLAEPGDPNAGDGFFSKAAKKVITLQTQASF